MTVRSLPFDGYTVVDKFGEGHAKRGTCGVFITKQAAEKSARYFDLRFYSKAPFRVVPVIVKIKEPRWTNGGNP